MQEEDRDLSQSTWTPLQNDQLFLYKCKKKELYNMSKHLYI